MRERIIRISIIVLLVVLNGALLFYYMAERRERTAVSAAELNRVSRLYQEAGIPIRTEIPSRNEEFNSLRLRAVDLDALVTGFLKDETYDRTYIYGAKVQYNAAGKTILADWQNHNIQYVDEDISSMVASTHQEGFYWEPSLTEGERLMLEQVGRRFASQWLGEELHLSEWRQSGQHLTLTFHSLENERIAYYNTVEVTVVKEGIERATITVWRSDAQGERLVTKPIDELLFQELPLIQETMARAVDKSAESEEAVLGIYYGYEIITEGEDTAEAVPNLTLILASGKQMTIRLTGE